MRLGADEASEPPVVREPVRLDHLPGGELRAADVANLAGADEIVESAQRLLERRHLVPHVQLVEVDVVRSQPPQRALDSPQDVAARGARAVVPPVARPHVRPELRREDDVVPAPLEDPAEDLLGAALLAVAVGCVDEVDARVERSVDDRPRTLQVDPVPERDRPEADDRDAQPASADLTKSHGETLPASGRRVIDPRDPGDMVGGPWPRCWTRARCPTTHG